MVDYMDLKPYLNEEILEMGKNAEVTEKAVLTYLSTIVVVVDSLHDKPVEEIDQWFTVNHYRDPYLKKEFDSLSSYLDEYALRYIREMGCGSMIMQKEDEDWMEAHKADYNEGFALLD